MTEPRRFRDGGGGALEKLVIDSVRDEAPAPAARRRTMVALGAAIGASGAASATTATTAAAASGLHTAAATVITKWVGVAALTAVAAAATTLYVRATEREAPRAPVNAPLVVPPPSPRVEQGVTTEPPSPPPSPSASPAPPAPPPASRPSSRAAPSPRAAPSAPPSNPPPTLGDELRMLEDAHTMLAAGDPAGALATLDRHARAFRDPALACEALVLRLEAHAARGDRADVERLATQFLRAYGDRPEAQRVRSILAAQRGDPNP